MIDIKLRSMRHRYCSCGCVAGWKCVHLWLFVPCCNHQGSSNRKYLILRIGWDITCLKVTCISIYLEQVTQEGKQNSASWTELNWTCLLLFCIWLIFVQKKCPQICPYFLPITSALQIWALARLFRTSASCLHTEPLKFSEFRIRN